MSLGFIPVAYTWLMSSLRPPIQLPSEPEDDTSGSLKPSGQRLRGWKVLLLFLPACCDLAGTTVSHFPFAQRRIRLPDIYLHLSLASS